MKTIQYVGTSDVRHLDAEDFEKAGLEGVGPVTFYGRQTQEFKNEVAEVFMTHHFFQGEFVEVEQPVEDKKSKSRASSDSAPKGTDQS